MTQLDKSYYLARLDAERAAAAAATSEEARAVHLELADHYLGLLDALGASGTSMGGLGIPTPANDPATPGQA